MTRITLRFLLAAVLGAAALAGCARAPEPAQPLLIRDVRIVSPERDAASAPTDVLVRDGRIAEIGTTLAADGATVIEGAGRYLAPGLIDGHVHLSDLPGMSYGQEQAFPRVAAATRRQLPRSYLFHGFTTVVDLNARGPEIAAWNRQDLAPRAFFCGGAPVADGYPMMWIPKPARYRVMPYFLLDPARTDPVPDGVARADHAPDAVVAAMRAAGAICVKTHYEPGFGGRGDWPTPSLALIRDLVAAAHAQDMPVLLHANSAGAQAFGLEAGVDGFAHGMWTWRAGGVDASREEVDGVLDATIARGVAVQPTIQVLYGERDLHDPDYLRSPALADVAPPALIDWYAGPDGDSWRVAAAERPYVAAVLENEGWEAVDRDAIARVTETLGRLDAGGARLVFGSDTPSDLTFANPPGLNGRLEIDRWTAAGVSPARIFHAATIEAAAFFGLDGEIGSVAVGKRADLLVLRGDPMTDAGAYDAIDWVIVNGRAVERAALSAREAD